MEDSFTLSGSVSDQFSKNEVYGNGVTVIYDASPTTNPSSGFTLHEEDDENSSGYSEDEDNVESLSYAEQCTKKLKQFRSAQKHRKCPHSFRICLIFTMFILLGILERGSFMVLFYLLNTHSLLEPGATAITYLMIKFFIYIMYPVAGFLADTFYGRHKVIRFCLCIAWLGSAFITFSASSMDDKDECDNKLEECYWPVPILVILGIGYAILGVGLTGIRVNLIPFGADQLPDASGGELSSYFHWYYFCITLGHLMAFIVLPEALKEGSLVYVFLGNTVIVTMFLSIFVLFHKQWLILPKAGNPLKLVYNVIKASFNTRQRQIKMSAFDVGMSKPTWIEKTMVKYGGIYTLEEVEAVKTFFRILVITMSCIGYYAVFSQVMVIYNWAWYYGQPSVTPLG